MRAPAGVLTAVHNLLHHASGAVIAVDLGWRDTAVEHTAAAAQAAAQLARALPAMRRHADEPTPAGLAQLLEHVYAQNGAEEERCRTTATGHPTGSGMPTATSSA